MQMQKSFPGRFESLGKISLFVKKASKKAGLDETQTYSVELAVDEACSNVIEHAYGGENIGDILCTCIVGKDSLTVIIRDRGRPFNPDGVPEINISAPPEERSPGGAGVFLMRKVMDSVEYHFTPQGNILTMIKRK